MLNASFQDVKRLFVIAYDAATDDNAAIKDNRKYFLPKGEMKNQSII